MRRGLSGVKARSILLLALVLFALVGAAPAVRHAHVWTALARAGHPSPRRVTIVAVGDSITKGDWDTSVRGGWVTRLGAKLGGAYPHTSYTVVNAGVDGDTAAGVLARLQRDVLAAHPGLVIVSIGTNDFDVDVPPALFAARLHDVVGRLQVARPAPAIILASMLPEAGQRPPRLAAQRAYNDIIRHTATSAHVGYLDLFDHWLAFGPLYLHTLRHDTEHPNPFGYELLASTTAAFLEGGYLDAQGGVMAPPKPPTCSRALCGP